MAMYYGDLPQEEEPFDQSTVDELKSMMFMYSNNLQKFRHDMNVEVDFICKDFNGKIDDIYCHLEKINAKLDQIDEVLKTQEEVYELKEVYSTSMTVGDYYALIDWCENIDTPKPERVFEKYIEVSLDIDYLNTLIDKLSVYEESSLLLEKINLGDAIDVDKILKEINNPKVENDCRQEDIVFHTLDGDDFDYFFMNSCEHEVDFVFSSHSFDPHVHLNNKEEVKFYATFVVNFLDFSFSILLWKTVCFFVHFVSYLNRRRIKGALAQPFDTYD